MSEPIVTDQAFLKAWANWKSGDVPPSDDAIFRAQQFAAECIALQKRETELCDGIDKVNNVGVGLRRENERLRERVDFVMTHMDNTDDENEKLRERVEVFGEGAVKFTKEMDAMRKKLAAADACIGYVKNGGECERTYGLIDHAESCKLCELVAAFEALRKPEGSERVDKAFKYAADKDGDLLAKLGDSTNTAEGSVTG